jgi:hypothetical protein
MIIKTFQEFITEELKNITSDTSSRHLKFIDKIYNDEDPDDKSPAAGILLKNKLKQQDRNHLLDQANDILSKLNNTKEIKPPTPPSSKNKINIKEFNAIKKSFNDNEPLDKYSTTNPKLMKMLVTLNNLQFLKHELKEKGELRCEYCNAGPLVIYDINPNKLDKLIDNPYYRLNNQFDPKDGATADHKVPQSKGGAKLDYSNLAVCCEPCNKEKKSQLYEDWLKKISKRKKL